MREASSPLDRGSPREMSSAQDLQAFLDSADVDAAVWALRPDYRALLIAVDRLHPGPSDAASEALLIRAEASARQLLAEHPVEDLPHVAAWREAYRGFGAKPQRTRNSLEALLRRTSTGLPRIDRLTDTYNAISVLHQVPFGGEDLRGYRGSPHLVRADGREPFDTTADGEPTIEHPEVGEVIWRDEVGVTCRRWNWRQPRRTALSEHTTSALFILDALGPVTDPALQATADDLLTRLAHTSPGLRTAQRLLRLP